MFEESCKDSENLHYLYSFHKHCGGGRATGALRTVALFAAAQEAAAGVAFIFGGGPVGIAFGSTLLAKSYNDYQEAWYGKSGYMRNAIGSTAYNTLDLGLVAHSVLRHVKRLNPYGNPEFDLFVWDKATHQRAYQSWGATEAVHWGLTALPTAENMTKDWLSTEMAWQEHLDKVRIDYD